MKTSFSTKRGFTLIEVLVAVTVFVIFLGASMQAYFAIADAVHKANNRRVLYSAGQDILTTIAREVRNGTIDYKCYADAKPSASKIVPLPQTGLATDVFCRNKRLKGMHDIVIRQADKRVAFVFNPALVKNAKSQLALTRHVLDTSIQKKWIGDREAGFKSIFDMETWDLPAGITIKDIRFRVTPYQNPFLNAKDTRAQFQPAVTIVLTMHSDRIGDGYTLPLQTTISSRVYDKLDN